MLKINKLNYKTIFTLIITGAPFYFNKNKFSWCKIDAPVIPLFFSILSGIVWGLPGFIKATKPHLDSASFDFFNLIIAFVISAIIGIIPIILLNMLLKMYYKYILKKSSTDFIGGSQRILYFSSQFQFLMFFLFSCFVLMNDFYSCTPWFLNVIKVGLIFFLFVRVLAVFVCTRREIKINFFHSVLTSLACIDAWLIGYFLCLS